MPMELVEGATIEQLKSAAYREQASIVKVTFVGTREDGFKLAIETPMRGDIAYERAAPGSIAGTGQKDSRGREYHRLNIGQRATREYLTEAVRRFGLHYGYAPTVTFSRDTGANPGKTVRSVSADEVHAKFDASGLLISNEVQPHEWRAGRTA